jgi:ADP-ribose pyrophosphatase
MDLKNTLPKRISRKNVYSSKWLDLNLDNVLLPTGKIVKEFHVIDFKCDSVVILMLNKRNEICFVKAYRYVTQTMELELPAGFIKPQETIVEAGVREVLEETGYVLEDAKHVYSFHPANAISNQKSHIVIGKCSNEDNIKEFDHNEVHDVLWLNNQQIIKLIKNKQIMDGYALITLLYYNTFLKEK